LKRTWDLGGEFWGTSIGEGVFWCSRPTLVIDIGSSPVWSYRWPARSCWWRNSAFNQATHFPISVRFQPTWRLLRASRCLRRKRIGQALLGHGLSAGRPKESNHQRRRLRSKVPVSI